MQTRRTATRRLVSHVSLVSLLGSGLSVLSAAPLAHADPPPSEETREEAKRHFSAGSSAYLAKRYAEALEELRASYKLVPSPNSGLLIARCLRELSRRVEAVDMYGAVAAEARRRAADGDGKYAQTADVATLEGGAVRATLGTLHVRVTHPPPGSLVEIDGTAVPATESELVVLHAAGDVTVKFKPRTGDEQSQRATLTAGNDVRMEFTPRAATETRSVDPPPPAGATFAVPRKPEDRTTTEPPGWTLPATLVAAGVALAGTGVFIGFRLQSDAIYNQLSTTCGPSNCGSAQQAKADDGKRDQTIADVGLAVGIVGAAATVAFLLVRAYSSH